MGHTERIAHLNIGLQRGLLLHVDVKVYACLVKRLQALPVIVCLQEHLLDQPCGMLTM